MTSTLIHIQHRTSSAMPIFFDEQPRDCQKTFEVKASTFAVF